MKTQPLFQLAPGLEFILASGSPRRKHFLDAWGLEYQVLPSEFEEPAPSPHEDPTIYTQNLAKAKAQACYTSLEPTRRAHTIILAADTTVIFAGQILGKPQTTQCALEMLRLLNGQKHLVTTSVHLILPDMCPKHSLSFSETSAVYFQNFPDAILASYAKTSEPRDKAGGYAIQGQGAFLIKKIDGSWSNVVGLPVSRLAHELLNLHVLQPYPNA